jgi:hypothetical protein
MTDRDRLWGTLVYSKESGRIEAREGPDGRWWFSVEVDEAGSYTAFDIAEAQLRGLLAFIDEIRKDEAA